MLEKNGKSAAITLHARLLPESLRFWNHKPGAGNWASEILICAWRPNASGLIRLVIPRASPFRRRRPLAGSTRPQYCCCGRDSTVRPRPSSVRGSPPRFDCRASQLAPPGSVPLCAVRPPRRPPSRHISGPATRSHRGAEIVQQKIQSSTTTTTNLTAPSRRPASSVFPVN